jgi:hypothetical protein
MSDSRFAEGLKIRRMGTTTDTERQKNRLNRKLVRRLTAAKTGNS